MAMAEKEWLHGRVSLRNKGESVMNETLGRKSRS